MNLTNNCFVHIATLDEHAPVDFHLSIADAPRGGEERIQEIGQPDDLEGYYRFTGHREDLEEGIIQFNVFASGMMDEYTAAHAHRYILQHVVMPHCQQWKEAGLPASRNVDPTEIALAGARGTYMEYTSDDEALLYESLIDLWKGIFDIPIQGTLYRPVLIVIDGHLANVQFEVVKA